MKRPMKRVIALLAVLGLALAAAGCGRKSQPSAALPSELKKLQCQKNSRVETYAEGQDFVRVSGTVIAVRCINPGAIKEIEQRWKYETSPYFEILFAKTPDGSFVVPDGTNRTRSPLAKNLRYIVETEVRPRPFGPFTALLYDRVEITVPTPAPFAVSGPQTTFQCSRPMSNGQLCWSRVQSKSLYWELVVRLGWPYPAAAEWEGELAEALNLAAAHIVKQD